MDYLVTERVIEAGERRIFGEAWLPQCEGPCPVVIFSHGYNGCYQDFRRITDILAKAGIATYAFDFCGGGTRSRSSGKTTELTLFTQREDLSCIIDAVRSWKEVDAERVYLFGGSQGGLVSALTAETNKEKLAGLMLLFPALGIPDNWRKNFPTVEEIPETVEFWGNTLGRVFFTAMRELSTFDVIGGFDKPVRIFSGDEDKIVPIDTCYRAEKAYPHAELTVFPGEGHGFTPPAEVKVADLVKSFVLGA